MKEADVRTTLPGRDPRRYRGKVVFSGNEEHLKILIEAFQRRSVRTWNQWRESHPKVVPDLRKVVLTGRQFRGINLSRARLDGAILNRTELAGAHLERASMTGVDFEFANLSGVHGEKADLSGARLKNATLRGADFRGVLCTDETSFEHANLQEANFARAKMIETNLANADLTKTCFDAADLTSANFSDAILDGTSFLGARLRGAMLFGAFVRRVRTDDKTDQHDLGLDVHVVWERRTPGKIIEFTDVDDIHVAQFHDILEEPGSVAKLLAASTKRIVLILGRFLPRRKRVLQRLAAALGDRGKIAVIFDFPGPNDREVSDTVRFIAGMSQFIIVDMTKASSVPLELQATIPDLMVPVLPIIESGHAIFSMFSDLQRRYFWIQPPVSYKNADQLVRHVDEAIIQRAERAAEQIKERRAASVRAPVSVVRINRNPRNRA